MSSVGERTAGHGDALGRKFIVINLRCIHAHIVQNDAKPQTGEAWGSLGTPHLSPTEGACPWAAGGPAVTAAELPRPQQESGSSDSPVFVEPAGQVLQRLRPLT